jgi:hypothetical protein
MMFDERLIYAADGVRVAMIGQTIVGYVT